jgi:pyruvate dehydrogenase (quinone)
VSMIVADHLLQRLRAWGITRIYGYPGDGINGIVGALDRAQDNIDFVQVRHEEMAAFMACGHAKFTGTLGVCLATSGPGAVHLLNGLYDAKLDHQPVLGIVLRVGNSILDASIRSRLNQLRREVAKA